MPTRRRHSPGLGEPNKPYSNVIGVVFLIWNPKFVTYTHTSEELPIWVSVCMCSAVSILYYWVWLDQFGSQIGVNVIFLTPIFEWYIFDPIFIEDLDFCTLEGLQFVDPLFKNVAYFWVRFFALRWAPLSQYGRLAMYMHPHNKVQEFSVSSLIVGAPSRLKMKYPSSNAHII